MSLLSRRCAHVALATACACFIASVIPTAAAQATPRGATSPDKTSTVSGATTSTTSTWQAFTAKNGAMVPLNPAAQLGPKLTTDRAIAIARAHTGVQRELTERGEGSDQRFTATATYVDGRLWEVQFALKGKTRVQADVLDASASVVGVWTGHQIPWKMARGDGRAFGGDINHPAVWWLLTALFVFVMIEWRRWRSLASLDVLALTLFTVSHAFYNHGAIHWSVPLAYPPLLWLTVRMGWLFARGVPPAPNRTYAPESNDHDPPDAYAPGDDRSRRWWHRPGVPTWQLLALAVFAAGMRIGINLDGSTVVDVGYAGVAGAHSILQGQLPYGHMPADNIHGDTYGPLNYVLYMPAVLLFGYDGDWGGMLPAAHATAIAADCAVVAGLALLGWRWMSRRAAALLAAGWLLSPYSAFALEGNVNDSIVAALLVWALVAVRMPLLRGLLIGAATCVKFVPLLAAAPLLHVGSARRLRQSLLVATGVAAAVAMSTAFILLQEPNGMRRFLRATVNFQYDRDSPFSIWGLWHLRHAQIGAQVVLMGAVACAALLPRWRDARQAAAGLAGVMAAVQLVLQHWFYLYIPWFLAPTLVVLVAQQEMVAGRLRRPPSDGIRRAPAPVE